jgi:hypothetical protein
MEQVELTGYLVLNSVDLNKQFEVDPKYGRRMFGKERKYA